MTSNRKYNCFKLAFKYIALIVLLLYGTDTFAQSFNNPLQLLNEKGEWIYGLDNRRTKINQQHATIYGLYMGVGFSHKLRCKIQVSGLPFERGKAMDTDGIVKFHRLLYFSIGEEFDFYQYKNFTFTTYIQAGIGQNYNRSVDDSDVEIQRNVERITPFEIGLHFSYDLKSYLKLKSGSGYRFVYPESSNALSGYYLKLGLGFNLKKFLDAKEVQ